MPPKGEGLGQYWVREHLDQRPTDDQVLLDLRILDSRRDGPPGGNVILRDHASTSMGALTTNRHSRERTAPCDDVDGSSLV